MLISTRKDLEVFVKKHVSRFYEEKFYSELRRMFVLYAATLHNDKFATEDLYKNDLGRLTGSFVGNASVIVATEEIDSKERDFPWPLIFVSLETGLHIIQLSENLLDELFTPNGGFFVAPNVEEA